MTASSHVVPVHPVEVEPGLWGWACSCGKASVCTSELNAEWGRWLHKIAVSGMATADELAVAS